MVFRTGDKYTSSSQVQRTGCSTRAKEGVPCMWGSSASTQLYSGLTRKRKRLRAAHAAHAAGAAGVGVHLLFLVRVGDACCGVRQHTEPGHRSMRQGLFQSAHHRTNVTIVTSPRWTDNLSTTAVLLVLRTVRPSKLRLLLPLRVARIGGGPRRNGVNMPAPGAAAVTAIAPASTFRGACLFGCALEHTA